MKKKIAICCDTPYQLLNACNLAYFSLKRNFETDLYYYDSYGKLEETKKRICEAKIFDHVYGIVSPKDGVKHLKSAESLLLYVFYIEKYINAQFTDGFDISKKHYDYIAITSATFFEAALIRYFPKARVIAYEEGLGSYENDVIHNYITDTKFQDIFLKKKYKIHVDALYVNNPQECRSITSKRIRGLIPHQEQGKDYHAKLQHIFQNDFLYLKRPLIYLSQPYEEIPTRDETVFDEIHILLSDFSSELVWRAHPREKENIKYNGLNAKRDVSHSSWELFCQSELTESQVLVSICSTAQITPKLLYDKEPWIIMFFRMVQIESEELRDYFLACYKMLKKKYHDKGKVMAPKNLAELKKAINHALR